MPGLIVHLFGTNQKGMSLNLILHIKNKKQQQVFTSPTMICSEKKLLHKNPNHTIYLKLTARSNTARWPYNKHIFTERKAEDETQEVCV